MLTKRKLLGFMVLAGASTAAHAQLGGMLGGMLGGLRGGGGGGDVSGLIDRFNADSSLISQAVAYALLQIKAALGTKEEAAQAKQQADDLGKTTDAKEAGALQGTIIKTDLARVGELTKAEEAKAKLEKLSPEIQKKVGQSILAVGISALKVPVLMDTGKKIVEGAGSNPVLLPKLASVKDGMSLLGDAAPKLGPIVTTGFALMREVKVDPGNPSKDAELKVDTSISIPD